MDLAPSIEPPMPKITIVLNFLNFLSLFISGKYSKFLFKLDKVVFLFSISNRVFFIILINLDLVLIFFFLLKKF